MESLHYDLLSISNDKEILNIIGNEEIYYSNKVTKISGSFSLKQERTLILTSNSIFVFQNKKLKRKLKYEEIHGISFSNQSNEFVIHGETDNDMHFLHQDQTLIIFIIIKCYENSLKKTLILCEISEKSLKSYVTTKKDKKRDPNLSRMDEKLSIDTQTFVIDNDPNENNKRSYTESVGGKISSIVTPIEEIPQTINSNVIFSNDEKFKSVIFDDFNIIKVVGKGNISKVFLAQNLLDKKYYTLKSIPKYYLYNCSSYKETVKSIKDLNHPFLINIKYCFDTNERIYFASPYIQGEEMSYHIKHHKNFPEQKVKFYAAILILVIEYLHQKDILYREFTPSNIIIDKDGYLKVTPFHIEKLLDVKKEIIENIDINEYTSPEVLEDINTMDIKGGDWWNLGVILFEMIYSVPPFYSNDDEKMKKFASKADLRFPRNIAISDNLKDLIKKLLNKNCEERIGYNGGFEEIKNHTFFKGFDFDALINKTLESPYKPDIGDILDDNKKISEIYTYEDLIKNGIISTN